MLLLHEMEDRDKGEELQPVVISPVKFQTVSLDFL